MSFLPRRNKGPFLKGIYLQTNNDNMHKYTYALHLHYIYERRDHIAAVDLVIDFERKTNINMQIRNSEESNLYDCTV